jgi:hypothetical protein
VCGFVCQGVEGAHFNLGFVDFSPDEISPTTPTLFRTPGGPLDPHAPLRTSLEGGEGIWAECWGRSGVAGGGAGSARQAPPRAASHTPSWGGAGSPPGSGGSSGGDPLTRGGGRLKEAAASGEVISRTYLLVNVRYIMYVVCQLYTTT